MPYNLQILPQAEKQLKKIDRSIQPKLTNAILGLSENPRPAGCKKLRNREGWRIRCGNYRIIYNIDDTEITVIVVTVKHRKHVYKK